MKNLSKRRVKLVCAVILLTLCVADAGADTLCKNKKKGSVFSRPTNCKAGEVAIAPLRLSSSSTSAAAASVTGTDIVMSDTGAVSSGSDLNTGVAISVTRTGATGGTTNSSGMSINVSGDGGGDSTNLGLYVSTSGADTNYCAVFSGGNVGIGVSDPDEALEIAGRLHLGQTSAPSTTTDKLYNVGGDLFWNGQEISVGAGEAGTITGVVAGSGLSGGGVSGSVTLSVDAGTSANQVVKLDGSAALPAVSGANLTALNAASIASGTLSDSRLSSNVSLLGPSIGLSSEVSGTLGVGNGGTGASSLADLIALGTHTSGNYVQSVATTGGLSGGASGTEGAALSLSVDQSFSPTWSGEHSFTGGVNIGTTTSSVEELHLSGRMQIEPGSAPGVTTNKLYNVGGALFFNGQDLTNTALGGDITGVSNGDGLTGGGTSGDVTLAVDSGTTAGKILKLNGSAQIPAVSGALLTNLNASNLASGTISDGLLSSSVSKLGTDIDLSTSEVTGVLPTARGGTGATSLLNLITLGAHTTGNYIATLSGGTGISVAGSGSESAAGTVSVDQSFTPSWTGTHTFSGVTTDITTGTNEDFVIIPNGTGAVGIGTFSPSAKLSTVLSSTSTSGATQTGSSVAVTDTGIVNSGTDTTNGSTISVSRTGATGGTINTIGLDLGVTGDTGGTSTATGLNVSVSGADTNYAALFSGGNVGIGTSVPTARLETNLSSASVTAGTEIGSKITVNDSGVVPSGADSTSGLNVSVSRTGASGGTISSSGVSISVAGDSGGTSQTTGLDVTVSGADTNYAALFSGGHVGVGTTTPGARLDTVLSTSSASAGSQIGGRFTVSNSGNVASGTDTTTGLSLNVSRTGASGGTILSKGLEVTVVGDSGGGSTATGLNVAVSGADTNVAAVFSGGSVEIGTSNLASSANVPSGSMIIDNGALCLENGTNNCDNALRNAGSIYATDVSITAIDLAEQFPIDSDTELDPGDIVMIDSRQAPKCTRVGNLAGGAPNCEARAVGTVPFVKRSSGLAGEGKRIIGVVSTAPGVTLGGYARNDLIEYGSVPVALAGRVPLKVNLEGGNIDVGDRITAASEAGVGRKANSATEQVVAIALEPYEGGETELGNGKILALVK